MQGGTVGQSPTRRRRTTEKHMTFPQAMRAIIEGKKITRGEWENPNIYCKLRKSVLMIKLKDGWHQWIVNEGDMVGQDWVVVK